MLEEDTKKWAEARRRKKCLENPSPHSVTKYNTL
jgi:hypothetical protein